MYCRVSFKVTMATIRRKYAIELAPIGEIKKLKMMVSHCISKLGNPINSFSLGIASNNRI